MTIMRWAGFSLGTAVLLAFLGIALAIILARVNQSVADTMTLRSSVLQASGDQLGLWNDRAKTNPVTSLSFKHLRVQPPLRSIGPDMPQATIFVENLTTGDLYLVGPCGNAVSPQGTILGFLDALVSGGPNELKGSTCNAVRLPLGQLFEVLVRIELAPGLAARDDAFQTVFEAVSQVAVPPPAGMVSWWPGDGHGNDIVDANDGTLVGGAGFAPGMVGQAFSFDAGLDSGVTVPNGANLNMTEAITLDAWVKPSSFPNSFPTVVRKHTDDGGNQYILAVTDQGRAHCNIGNFVNVTGGTVVLNEWTHVACVYDRVAVRVYVNGGQVEAVPATQPMPASSMPLGIGRSESLATRNFDGLIDEVEIFDRALRGEEIRAIYDAGSAGKIKPPPPPPPEPIPPPAGMVSWWPGDGNADDIIDGNPGTLSGDATFALGMVGEAFTLDGTGDFVVVPDSPNLNITSDVTVDLWAKRTVVGSGSPVMIARGAGAIGVVDAPDLYFLSFDSTDHLNGGFERADGSNVILVGPTVTDTNFHHYAYVRSGDTHNLFMDGVMVTGDTFTGSPGDTTGIELAIGALRHDAFPGGFCCHFGGVIDEVEIFNRALTAAEIRAIYKAGGAGKIKPEPIPPPAGMVSWWPGDGNANDIVDGNPGTLQGGATFAPGKVGQAFSFDGLDDYVVMPDSVNLDLTEQFTLDAWINPSSLHNAPLDGALISKVGGAAGNNGYQFGITGNNAVLLCQFNAAGEPWPGNQLIVDLPSAIPLDQWSHVACTYDNADLKIYVNGGLVGTQPVGAKSVVDSASSLRISGDDNNHVYFHGLIDEVGVFNRALTASEVRAIYTAGSAGKIKP